MSRPARKYTSNHQVFGELEVTLQIEGSDSKNNKSSLCIKNLSGCYPFIVHVPGFNSIEANEVEIELEGSGEETSLLECLVEITEKLKKDGWISHRDIENKTD